MKVIITSRSVCPFHKYGGMEKYVHYLCKYIAKEGFDVEIITALDKTREKEKKQGGIEYFYPTPG